MSEESEKRLPWVRLVIYLIIVGICGAVAAYELFYALAGDTTTATILAVGRTSPMRRTSTYWAEYEFFDADQVRHVGRSDFVHPTTKPFDLVEVQYLRHAPEMSRLAPSAAGGLCYGSVALLAVIVFVAEIVTRRRQQVRSEFRHRLRDEN